MKQFHISAVFKIAQRKRNNNNANNTNNTHNDINTDVLTHSQKDALIQHISQKGTWQHAFTDENEIHDMKIESVRMKNNGIEMSVMLSMDDMYEDDDIEMMMDVWDEKGIWQESFAQKNMSKNAMRNVNGYYFSEINDIEVSDMSNSNNNNNNSNNNSNNNNNNNNYNSNNNNSNYSGGRRRKHRTAKNRKQKARNTRKRTAKKYRK